MILVFYNEDMNVCIYEYRAIDGGLNLARKDVFYNDDVNAKEFRDILRTDSHFMEKVLLSNQDRFKETRVIIFDSLLNGSLYDRTDLVDMLFLHRRKVTVLKADITEEDAKTVATWLYKHFPA